MSHKHGFSTDVCSTREYSSRQSNASVQMEVHNTPAPSSAKQNTWCNKADWNDCQAKEENTQTRTANENCLRVLKYLIILSD